MKMRWKRKTSFETVSKIHLLPQISTTAGIFDRFRSCILAEGRNIQHLLKIPNKQLRQIFERLQLFDKASSDINLRELSLST